MPSVGRLTLLVIASVLLVSALEDSVDSGKGGGTKRPAPAGGSSGGGGAQPPKRPAPGGPSGGGGAPPPKKPAPGGPSGGGGAPPGGSGPSTSGTQPNRPPGRKQLPDEAIQCVCGGTTLSLTDVKNALTQGSNHIKSGTKAGKYPEAYDNKAPGTTTREVSFPGNRCASNNIFWYEYPVIQGGTYTSGSPGPYRAVWTLSNDFCGCIEHPSKTNPGFVACTD